MSLLDVSNLAVRFPTPAGVIEAVADLTFQLEPAAALAIVGESGSGKSQTALAILGLAAGAEVGGRIVFDGQDLRAIAPAALDRIRGGRIGMVFQDPGASLHPCRSIGTQLAEVLEVHRGATHREGLAEAARLLDAVRLPQARARLGHYPHQLSGGQRQRVMIAAALMCRPQLLIADEPTTALDPTVQAQLLDLLAELKAELGMALLLISHDLGVVEELCERVVVLQAGRKVEEGPTAALLARPAHPHSQALVQARLALAGAGARAPAAG